MAPPCRRPRSPPALMEDVVEDILLRVPPDEPAHLIRAALVWKAWRCTLTDRGFLRRYRGFHRAPPLLGYFHNLRHKTRGPIPPFVPTTAASPLPPPPLDRGSYWARDCRHGRVLLHAFHSPQHLLVWDPITGDRKELSVPSSPHTYAGAVLRLPRWSVPRGLCGDDESVEIDARTNPRLLVSVN
ncbi:hypothetical protein C2845_PM03G18720 [Panicum miliaceum]|uniref:F-box domain-containing protein n=1 Tax=Panicum miliaceum TaxID=4540 RepID=A0A3L6TAF6_PANMI|nr:hypothetical protein C2845_PM03G18720 [Panicum miliaceum]